MTPVVSIVTPAYNAAQFLPLAVESVRAQTYPHIEHLVLDGGSTDGTQELLERLAADGAPKWWSEPDDGQADALVKGFARATGDILGWLNADDVYLDDRAIERVVAAFAADDVGVVTGGGRFVSESGAPLEAIPAPVGATLDDLRRVDVFLQPATFFRREVLESAPIDPTLHYAFDWDFFVRALERHRLLVIDDALAGYRLHGGSKTVAGGSRRIAELAEVTRRHLGTDTPQYRTLAALAFADRQLDRLPATLERPSRRFLYGGVMRGLRVASRGRIQT